MRKIALIGIGTVLAGVSLAGCGGGGDTIGAREISEKATAVIRANEEVSGTITCAKGVKIEDPSKDTPAECTFMTSLGDERKVNVIIYNFNPKTKTYEVSAEFDD